VVGVDDESGRRGEEFVAGFVGVHRLAADSDVVTMETD
jgi:hypothetical protein